MSNAITAGVAVALVTALAAGCTAIGRSQPPKTVFDFGPPAERFADAVAPAGVALDVRAPAWIDSPRIAYRLAYEDAAERREYVESRWAGSAGALLAQRLRQRLGLGGAGGRCTLRVNIEEFAQVFQTPEKSSGVLSVDAQLVDARGRLAAQAAFVGEAPAPTADARGGVAALRGALDRGGSALNDWLRTDSTKAVLAGCAG